MGKGDKKSKRGKIAMGSFGVTRARKKETVAVVATVPAPPAPKKTAPAVAAKKK